MRSKLSSTLFPEFRIIKEYWQMLTIIGTIIFFGVYLFVENREYRDQVESLSETNKELRDRISRLEGQMEVTHSVLNNMFENDPSILDYRLEKLEDEFNKRKVVPKQQTQTIHHFPNFYPQIPTYSWNFDYKKPQPQINTEDLSGSVEKKKGLLNLFKKQEIKKE